MKRPFFMNAVRPGPAVKKAAFGAAIGYFVLFWMLISLDIVYWFINLF